MKAEERKVYNLYKKEIQKYQPIKGDALRLLVERYQVTQDERVLSAIFAGTCKLGSKIAHQFTYSNTPIEDLIGFANEAILKAARTWSAKWANISQYFAYEIYNYLRNIVPADKIVKLPYDLLKDIKQTEAALEQGELRDEFVIPSLKYQLYHNANQSQYNDELELEDELDEKCERIENLLNLIHDLPTIERQIMELWMDEGLGILEIAERLSLPILQVNLLFRKSVTSLGQHLTFNRDFRADLTGFRSFTCKNGKTVKIHKDGIQEIIYKTELEEYVANGWQTGRFKRVRRQKVKAEKKIKVKKEKHAREKEEKKAKKVKKEKPVREKKVKKEKPLPARLWMFKDEERNIVKIEDVQSYIERGYQFGRPGYSSHVRQKERPLKPTLWITKDGKNTIVKRENLELYLEKGYQLGRSKVAN